MSGIPIGRESAIARYRANLFVRLSQHSSGMVEPRPKIKEFQVVHIAAWAAV